MTCPDIEICSGYGRWHDGTVRLDVDSSTRPDIVADVRYLPLRPNLQPKRVIATPPCTYISKARLWRYGFNPLGFAEGLEIAAACARAFVYLEGEDFIFEWGTNLENLLGHKVSFTYDKADIRNATTTFYSNRKGLKRANIPEAVHQAILQSIAETDSEFTEPK